VNGDVAETGAAAASRPAMPQSAAEAFDACLFWLTLILCPFAV